MTRALPDSIRTKYLQVQDLEAEKQGVQVALKAALLMLSERNSRSSETSPHKDEDTSLAPANDAEITSRLDSVAVSSLWCVLACCCYYVSAHGDKTLHDQGFGILRFEMAAARASTQ